MALFEVRYKKLNDQQKRAVEAIEGTVMVVAGPGTGKTELLSMRIANILRKTDTRPSNILALTYTNKAAVNMKDRIIELDKLGGPKVVASTFHSFAAEIMNLYPDQFWNGASLKIAPESVQLDIIESVLDSLDFDNPLALKFAGQYTLIKDVQSAINLAKDAGLNPDKLRDLCKVNLAYIDQIEQPLADILAPRLSPKTLGGISRAVNGLPSQDIDEALYPLVSLSTVLNESLNRAIDADQDTNKVTNSSNWKRRWLKTVEGRLGLHSERARNMWWLELSAVYGQYRAQMHQRGFYDYADMLVEVIAQLDQNPEMLADTQERFNYVLVDEFQDTTAAQLRLARQVADHFSAEGKPNLMVVGDDDQTIFRFNGAEVNNMLNFERHYPSLKKIVLTDNYRSSQAILDFAKSVISQADSRLVNIDKSLKKSLVAKDPPKKAGQIRTLSYDSREVQLSQIASDINLRHKKGEQIAVLARGHDSLIRLAGLLEQLGLPVRYERSANILEHEIIKQTYLASKLLLAIQSGDRSLSSDLIHKIIRWPAWGVEPKALWHLASQNFSQANWLESMQNSKNSELKNFSNWLIDMSAIADSQPLAVTIEQIIGLRPSKNFTSPVRDYYLKKQPSNIDEYFYGLSAMQLLRNLVNDFGAERQPSLTDLVRFFELNQQNGVVVADESPYISGQNAIQLMTVFKAKGLEFEHTYVIDAIDDNWRPKKAGRKPPTNLPLQPHGDEFDDYVRLAFVATTRAERSLTISAYNFDHIGKEVAISPIFASVQPFKKIELKDSQVLLEVIEQNLRWPALNKADEKAMLGARLEDYSLNVTALLNFLDVSRGGPQYFKERNLLKLPEAKTASLAYGTAVHKALKHAQQLTNHNRFKLSAVLAEFKKALIDEQLPPQEHSRRLKKGQLMLKKLFEDNHYQLPAGALAELKVRDTRVGKAIISGDLDSVLKTASTITITDYKTGAPLDSFASKSQAIKAYKHKTQLIFYSLLVGANSQSKVDTIGQMVYVEATSSKKLTLIYQPTAEDKQRLSKLIQIVYAKITALDVPNTDHYPKTIEGLLQFEANLLK